MTSGRLPDEFFGTRTPPARHLLPLGIRPIIPIAAATDATRRRHPPGSYSRVTPVSFSWDSSQLPDGVNAGDPFAIEIGSNNAARGPVSYLDFDNVRVSTLANPEG